jgi:hypothetical protein
MATRTTKRSEATKTSTQNRKEQEEESLRQWKNYATESVIGSFLDPQSNRKTTSYGRLDKAEIEKLLKNPYVNYKQLQAYSHLFMSMEGIYYRIIKFYANMLTYDHMTIPSAGSKTIQKYKNKLQECYDTVNLYLEKMNLKYNLPIFAEDLLTDGECYYYEIEDSTGILYQKINNEFCLPYKNENGLWRYVIDCMKLSSEVDLTVYPIEIQKAMSLYLNNKVKDSNVFLFDRYYPVKNGICFTTIRKGEHSTPPFAFLFKDLLALEQKKDLKDKIDRVNNTKMIHNKIETKDKDTMIDPTVAKNYNDAIKRNLTMKNLEDGIFTITNPFEAKILNLNTKDSETRNLVKDAVDMLFDEAGISGNIFNAGTSSEAMKDSIINDSALVINLLLQNFSCFVNEKLRILKTKVRMKCVILDNTYYNIENRRTSSVSELAYGGSRLRYLADKGYTPAEGMSLLQSERILGIDDLFVPIATSHTMSQKDGQSGRPNVDEMHKNGQSTSEITDQVNEGK